MERHIAVKVSSLTLRLLYKGKAMVNRQDGDEKRYVDRGEMKRGIAIVKLTR